MIELSSPKFLLYANFLVFNDVDVLNVDVISRDM
jgi:hypothetical protein